MHEKELIMILKELEKETRRIADELNWSNRMQHWKDDQFNSNVTPPSYSITRKDIDEQSKS